MKTIVYIGKALGLIGGIERYMQNSSLLLRKNGFAVHYFYTGKKERNAKEFSAAFDSVQEFSTANEQLQRADLIVIHNIIPPELLKTLPEKKTFFLLFTTPKKLQVSAFLVFLSSPLPKNAQPKKTLKAVVTTITIRQGIKISAGLLLPADARNPITVLGNSSNPLEFIKNKIAIPLVNLLLPLAISSVAFTAVGVLALATPIKFADILTDKYSSATGDTTPNNRLVIGLSKPLIAERIPKPRMISINPNQIQ